MTEHIGNRLRAVGDFVSVFFNLIGTPAAGANSAELLAELLRSDEFATAVPKLLPLNPEAAKRSTALNRYEFEGSLVAALLISGDMHRPGRE
jgi:hypothetical protein